MKALILASAMMADPAPSLQQPGVESGVYDTSSHISKTIAETIPLDNE